MPALQQNVFFELSHLWTRLQSQLLVKSLGEVREHAQRLGLTATSVQSQHELTRQTFVKRELLDLVDQQIDDGRRLTESEAHVRQLFES